MKRRTGNVSERADFLNALRFVLGLDELPDLADTAGTHCMTCERFGRPCKRHLERCQDCVS
jgi:hypothetical protein